ncbi:hypothetical protein [uncultured Roseobacter sp.]|uniref:hypothetical protein n=1 Tax=uncultured Roseobacter sp. TaxID=114847 RepID=UPI00262A8E65|nr:hypothetical protein [uncultured Roseobacter sp.]
MTKLRHFDESRRAVERCVWKGLQSQRIFETAQEEIAQSKRLMEIARNPKPIYRASDA